MVFAVHESTFHKLGVLDYSVVAYDPITLDRTFRHLARVDTYTVDIESGVWYLSFGVAGFKMKVGIDPINDVDVRGTSVCCVKRERFDGLASSHSLNCLVCGSQTGLVMSKCRKIARETSYTMIVSGARLLADSIQPLYALTCIRLWLESCMAQIEKIFRRAHAFYGRLNVISVSIGSDDGVVDCD
jgi:hypothetical protein